MKRLLAGVLPFVSLSVLAQNAPPIVSNVSFSNTAGVVTVNYDVNDAEESSVEIILVASADGGKTFSIVPKLVTGDVGTGVSVGTGKQITWLATAESPTNMPNSLTYRVIADDGVKPDIAKVIEQIKQEQILEKFFQVFGNNHPASPEHYDQTRAYIHQYYDGLGYRARRDTFMYPNRNGVNIIGVKPGLVQEDSSVLLSGHYDTVEPTPGADDNNMSVAIMLEAARVLKDYQFRNSIVFANWDLEEVALVGAYYYATSANTLGLKSVINFDGISIYKEEPNSQQVPTGFDVLFPDAYAKAEADSFRGNFITLIGDAKSASLNSRMVEHADQYTPDLRYIDLTCPDPSCAIATDLRRSDHAPFWDRGIPAVFLTSTTEFRSACYHQACDTTYNIDFSTKVIKLATSLLMDEAQPMHAGYADAQGTTAIHPKLNSKDWFVAEPYPNPVDVHAFFTVGLGESDQLNVTVYDAQGKEVAVVFNNSLPQGVHTIAWNIGEDVAPGMYYAKVSTNKGLAKTARLMVTPAVFDYSHTH